ncbi:acyl-CoA dehydrogenase family protein [Ramlibacter sp. AN1015]|uniref:acyl-CoA dehydrogenase family protein n=1 Tax=Ramlibacter sp. AN1015 TaxID=3133428 RepID=UPI0030C1E9E0
MHDFLTEGLQKLLQDECTPHLVRAIEAGEPAGTLWSKIEVSGFADALLPESAGGAGLALGEVYPLLELCGTFAVPVPLAHTMLARALLAQADVERPLGSITIAAGVPGGSGGVRCTEVAFGRVADWVLTSAEDAAVLLPVHQALGARGVFPLDAALEWSEASVAQSVRVPGRYDLQVHHACATAAQIAGALASVLARSLQYANDRQQFGRPIGKFQAIQHQLSVLAEHTFAARMAAQIGCQSETCTPERLRVAVAKARTSEAALEAASIAHSVHGALGFTAEFDLQLHTRRLYAWRGAAGSESYWHMVLGDELVNRREGLALDLIRATTDSH